MTVPAKGNLTMDASGSANPLCHQYDHQGNNAEKYAKEYGTPLPVNEPQILGAQDSQGISHVSPQPTQDAD